MKVKKIFLARPRGFCAGVERAINVVLGALDILPGPIYVLNEIVHNNQVVNSLRLKGAIFVRNLEEVPDGAVIIFSAHGVSPQVRTEAAARHLSMIDATCPLVAKVHLEARRFAELGMSIILVGDPGHDEVLGTAGEAVRQIQVVESLGAAEKVEVRDSHKVAVITQTTLSLDETRGIIEVLKRRFKNLVTPAKEDICYATQNRQNAVKALARLADLVLVLGSTHSSNSARLMEVAIDAGARAHLIESDTEILPGWLEDVESVGVTAGASTPESHVMRVVAYFSTLGVERIEELEVAREDICFPLPLELRNVQTSCVNHRGEALVTDLFHPHQGQNAIRN